MSQTAVTNFRRNIPQQRRWDSVLSIGLLTALTLTVSSITPVKANAPVASAAPKILLETPLTLDAPPTDDVSSDDATSGPVRMVRFSELKGDVTWRGGTNGNWDSAERNMPLRQGAQIWVSDNSRAEIQFDDGSRLRVDSNTLITLQTLYSDSEGEFTEITLNEGRIALRLKTKYSTYQVNTPLNSVKAKGPTRLRISAGDGVQVGVTQGEATVEGETERATLGAEDYLNITDSNSAYTLRDLPEADDFDQWNEDCDQKLVEQQQHASYQYVPSNIALCTDDLESYGSWYSDPHYGHIWVPHHEDANWRPYYYGHWAWVEPFGWTWVSNERWGWAPYHYGTWIRSSYGWAWVPGPREQYWSPGVVTFYQSGNQVAWCPLAPHEVRYPPRIPVGFRHDHWSNYFSVGGAAVYYPTSQHVCVARPWSPHYINHVTYVTSVTNIRNVTVNHNTYITNNHFVSVNTHSAGATMVSTHEFGAYHYARPEHGREPGAPMGVYHPVAQGAANAFFAHAHAVGAPVGGRPVAGPQAVVVKRQPRTLVSSALVPQAVLTRPVYRALLPASVATTTALPGQRFTNLPSVPAKVNPHVNPPASTPVYNRVNPPVHDTVLPPTVVTRPLPQTNYSNTLPPAMNPGERTEHVVIQHGTVDQNTTPPVRRNSGLDNYLRERNGGQPVRNPRTTTVERPNAFPPQHAVTNANGGGQPLRDTPARTPRTDTHGAEENPVVRVRPSAPAGRTIQPSRPPLERIPQPTRPPVERIPQSGRMPVERIPQSQIPPDLPRRNEQQRTPPAQEYRQPQARPLEQPHPVPVQPRPVEPPRPAPPAPAPPPKEEKKQTQEKDKEKPSAPKHP